MKNPLGVIKFVTKAFVVFLLAIIAVLFFIKKVEYVEGVGQVYPTKLYQVYSKIEGDILSINKSFGDTLKKGEIIYEINAEAVEKKIELNKIEKKKLLTKIEAKEIELDYLIKEAENNKIKSKIIDIEIEDLTKELANINFLVKIGQKSFEDLNKLERDIEKKKLENLFLKNQNNTDTKQELIKKEITGYEIENNLIDENIKQLESDYNNRLIKSNADNLTIITKNIDELEGSYIEKGKLLCTLADMQNLKMIVNIGENDIGKIRVGKKAIIFLDSIPFEKFTTLDGIVSKVYPQSADAEKDTYDKVEIDIKGFSQKLGPEKLQELNLRSGLKGKARIIIKPEKKLYRFFLDKIFE